MKIATGNRLAHYQIEYNELIEQTTLLNQTLIYKQQEYQVLCNYFSVNQGDKNARTRLNKSARDIKSLRSNIERNKRRMLTLQRQMKIEMNKVYGRRH